MLYEKISLALALALLCCVAVAQNIGPNNDPFVKVPVLSIDDYTLGDDAVFTIPVNLTLPSNYPVYQKYNIWPGYWDYFVATYSCPRGCNNHPLIVHILLYRRIDTNKSSLSSS